MANKKIKVKIKDLLDLEAPEADLTITAKFALNSVTLKESRWDMKLIVYKILPKTYYGYSIKFVVDEEPFETRIKGVEQKIERIRENKSLFIKTDEKDIKDHNSLIRDIRIELAEMKNQCPEIEFVATVKEIKYKDNTTSLVVAIPDTCIEPINKSKMLITHYKLNLYPIL